MIVQSARLAATMMSWGWGGVPLAAPIGMRLAPSREGTLRIRPT